MDTSLQDLFSADSPPRAPVRAATPSTPGTPAGPSRVRAHAEALFLSPSGSVASPSRRKRPRSPSAAAYDRDVAAHDRVNDEDNRDRGIWVVNSDDEGENVGRGSGGVVPRARGEVFDDPFAVQDPFGGLGNELDEDAPKPRRVMAKVDAERLLGPKGLPALVGAARKWRPRGKGNEVKDLHRLLDMYQMWAHSMFPKGDFAYTVQRVETVCRTRRMVSAVAGLRDAFYPKERDRDPDEMDLGDEDEEAAAAAAAAEAEAEMTQAGGADDGTTGPQRQPLFDEPDEPDFDEMLALEEAEREAAAGPNGTANGTANGTGSNVKRTTATWDDEPPVIEEEDEWEGLYD